MGSTSSEGRSGMSPFGIYGCDGECKWRGAKWYELLWGLLWPCLGWIVAAAGSTSGEGQSGMSFSGVSCGLL